MNDRIAPVIILALLILTIGCSGKKEIQNFDSQVWISDKKGCNENRYEMLPRLENLIYELKGMKEPQLQKVLGKPDKTELYERGQRFLIYDVSPDNSCNINYQGQQVDLILRLNALGIVSEANLQSYEDFNSNQ